MDYCVILVFFIAFCGRITCSPLLAEMMGTGPAPGPSKPKTAKSPSKDMPLGLQPALKPETRKTVMAPDNRALTKVPQNTQKVDPTLDILSSLDNPMLGSQLDALLGGPNPFNLNGPGSQPMKLESPTGGSKPFDLNGPGSKPVHLKTPNGGPKALPPKPKGVKSLGNDMPLGLKPGLKPDIRKNGLVSDKNTLLKRQPNTQKIDPTLDISSTLDNPLLGSQLDALLGGSKPFNLISPGSKPMNLLSPAGGSKPFNFIGPGSKPVILRNTSGELKAIPPKPKSVKSPGNDMPLGLKPGVKPNIRRNGIVSDKNGLLKRQSDRKKLVPTFDILRTLNSPLFNSQLDALLRGSKPFNLISPGSRPMNFVSPTGGSKPFNLMSTGSKPVNLVSPLGASKPMNLVSPFSSYPNPMLEAQLDKMFGAMPAFSRMSSMSFPQNPLLGPQVSNIQKSKVDSSQNLKNPILEPSSMRVPAHDISSKKAETPSQTKTLNTPLSVTKSKRPPPPRPPTEVGSPGVVAGVVDIKKQTRVESLKKDRPIDALDPLPGSQKQQLLSSNLNQPVDKLSLTSGSRDFQPESQLSNSQGMKGPSQPKPPSSKMSVASNAGAPPIAQDQFGSVKGVFSEMLPGAAIGPDALKPQVSQNEISAVLDEMTQMINSQSPPGGSNVDLGGAPASTPRLSNGGSVSGKKPTDMSWLAQTGHIARGNQPVDMSLQVPNGGSSSGTKPSDIPWKSQTGGSAGAKQPFDMPWEQQNKGPVGGTKPSDIPWESQTGGSAGAKQPFDMPWEQQNKGPVGGTQPSDIPWESQTGGSAGAKQPFDMPWEQQNKGPVGGTQPSDIPWESQTGGSAGAKQPFDMPWEPQNKGPASGMQAVDMPWESQTGGTPEAKPSYDMSLPTKGGGIAGGTIPINTPLLETGGSMKWNKPPGLIDMSLLNLGGGFPKSKPPVDWLGRDIGTAVREAAPVYTQKKAKPVKTVCTLKDVYAVCNLDGNRSKPQYQNVTGTLYLKQTVKKKCEYDTLNIQVDIDNVPMNDGTLFHGIHIHQYGDMTNGCQGMGSHFNPADKPHGAPWQPNSLRHVGDLGNVRQRRKDGKIYTRIVDYVAKLYGPDSIIGRGIGLKTERDDLGQGADEKSKIDGNSGEMMACCVISRSRPHKDDLYTLH